MKDFIVKEDMHTDSVIISVLAKKVWLRQVLSYLDFCEVRPIEFLSNTGDRVIFACPRMVDGHPTVDVVNRLLNAHRRGGMIGVPNAYRA